MNCAPKRFDKNYHLRVDEAFFDKLDDIRRVTSDLPPHAEVIRQLVDERHAELVDAGLVPGKNPPTKSVVEALRNKKKR